MLIVRPLGTKTSFGQKDSMVDHHSHNSDHSHAGGPNAAGNHPDINTSRLGWAAALTGIFLVVEVIGGFYSGSLTLLADAGHMFADLAALALAWFAAHLARRPADWAWTYGFDRVSVLVAFVNGVSLFVIAAMIAFEAAQRLLEPGPVAGPLMMGVAISGLVVNLLVFWVLHGADHSSLNIRSAALHVMGDLLGSVAAILAAGIIILSGWTAADPILSVIVVVLILRSAWYVVKESGRILLEGSPRDFDRNEVAADLVANVSGIADVHHVHVWSISENRKMMTLHVRVTEPGQSDAIVARIKSRLMSEHGIVHATIETEHGACADSV